MPIDDQQIETQVTDETEDDTTVVPMQYEITSYGADLDTEGLVSRLKRKDIFIPDFQRDYVWSQREASRFIESLLLGLPVPGIFLAKEPSSKRMLVIDGQQRLKTLQFFLDGHFNPLQDSPTKRVFTLQGVQDAFEGKTFDTLGDKNQRTLRDSVIHATIVKQESPKSDHSSIYHIFERLNNSGRKLSPQQIRVAIYHGFAVNMLHELNDINEWRMIYGRRSKTLKDEELILRFFALKYYLASYSRPMADFLNNSIENIIRQGPIHADEHKKRFINTIQFIFEAIKEPPFRPERSLNAAVFDSVMVGTSDRLEKAAPPDPIKYAEAYNRLLTSGEYINLFSRATADDNNVRRRIELATAAFAELEPAQ